MGYSEVVERLKTLYIARKRPSLRKAHSKHLHYTSDKDNTVLPQNAIVKCWSANAELFYPGLRQGSANSVKNSAPLFGPRVTTRADEPLSLCDKAVELPFPRSNSRLLGGSDSLSASRSSLKQTGKSSYLTMNESIRPFFRCRKRANSCGLDTKISDACTTRPRASSLPRVFNTLINQYNVVESLGEGTFSKCYLVLDIRSGQYFACKMVDKKRLKRLNMWKCGPIRRKDRLDGGSAISRVSDNMDMIRKEIAILKRISKHPHIVTLIDVLDDSVNNMLYIVLELCEYGSIMTMRLHQTVPHYNEHLARHYFRGIVLGLEYLHSLNIIHRDIKPENILLNKDNRAVIGDFSVSATSFDEILPSSSLTPLYMPPECTLQSVKANPSVDVWGLGITLFCLTHGRVPFEYNQPNELYSAIRFEKITAKIKKETTPLLKDLIKLCMEKEPERRISVKKIKTHLWTTAKSTEPMPSSDENCLYRTSIDITEKELDDAVKPAIRDKLRLRSRKKLDVIINSIFE